MIKKYYHSIKNLVCDIFHYITKKLCWILSTYSEKIKIYLNAQQNLQEPGVVNDAEAKDIVEEKK